MPMSSGVLSVAVERGNYRKGSSTPETDAQAGHLSHAICPPISSSADVNAWINPEHFEPNFVELMTSHIEPDQQEIRQHGKQRIRGQMI